MRVLVSRELLQSELMFLKGLFGKNGDDGHTSVELIADDTAQTLMLRAASQTHYADSVIGCRVVEGGEMNAQLPTMSVIATNCETPDVTIGSDELRVSVESDEFSAVLSRPIHEVGQDRNIRAWRNQPKGAMRVAIKTDAVRKMMKALAFALPAFEGANAGVLVAPQIEGGLQLVATQGHCLGVQAVAGSADGPIELPKSAIDVLQALSSGTDSRDLLIEHGAAVDEQASRLLHISTLSETGGERHVILGRKAMQFPAFQRIIPSQSDRVMAVTMDTHQACAVAKRVRLMASKQMPGIMISIADGQITMSSHADGFESAESFDVTVEGAESDHRLKLNNEYLVPALLGVDEPSVTLGIYKPDGPVTFHTADGGTFIFARMKT